MVITVNGDTEIFFKYINEYEETDICFRSPTNLGHQRL